MKTLLITPPLTDWNSPYPAISYLSQSLRAAGHHVDQADLSIQLIHKVYSADGLQELAGALRSATATPSSERFLAHFDELSEKIPLAIKYLSGSDPHLAHRINQPHFLSAHHLEFRELNYLYSNVGISHTKSLAQSLAEPGGPFGSLGFQDRARYLATLLLKTVTHVIRDSIDPHWGFAAYGATIDRGSSGLNDYLNVLEQPGTLISQWIQNLSERLLQEYAPQVVGITIPFSGNVLGALQTARAVRRYSKDCKIIFGGGFVNTQLRQISTPTLFQWVDFISLDDGELPLSLILEHLQNGGAIQPSDLKRTFLHRHGMVTYADSPHRKDIPMSRSGFPDYSGLQSSAYLSVLDQLHPMHQVWTGAQWNKLTLAHGCYWKQCAFCDTHLDYVQRYESAPIDRVLDRIEKLIQETGVHGFHFVDEAISPATARKLSVGLLERGISISWWGNVRFDRAFTPELTELMANAGCIAVTAGLESATNRILDLMKKGTTDGDIAKVAHAFSSAKILVHAYLIYGFPTQTIQEAIDDLEFVRQMFLAGHLASGVWHRFTVTRSSGIGKSPEHFGIALQDSELKDFSNYVIAHLDPTEVPWNAVGEGMERALKNFLHGQGFNKPVREWFPKTLTVPKTRLKSNHLLRLIQERQNIRRATEPKIHHHPHRPQGQIGQRSVHGVAEK